MHAVGRQSAAAPQSKSSTCTGKPESASDKLPNGKAGQMKSGLMNTMLQKAYEFTDEELNEAKGQKTNSKANGSCLPLSASPFFEGALFKLLDTNADGFIHASEYVVLHNAMREELPDSAMFTSFKAVDTDGNGRIDPKEWDTYISAIIEVLGGRNWKDAVARIMTKLKDPVMRKALGDSLGELPAPPIQNVPPVSNVDEVAGPKQLKQNSKSPYLAKQQTDKLLETLDKDWLLPDANQDVKFSPSEVALLKKYFRMRDANDSNQLDTEELMQVMKDLGRMPEPDTEQYAQFMAMRSLVDSNHDSLLGFHEFLAFLQAYYQETYRNIFGSHDRDGNNHISRRELFSVVQSLNQRGFDIPMGEMDQIDELIKNVDTDDDGNLDFSEFCYLMQGYRKIEFDYLKACAGFDLQSVKGLRELFHSMEPSHDIDGAKRLAPREVARLLDGVQNKPGSAGRSLQTCSDLHKFGILFSRTDLDMSQTLDFEEFLRLLRVWSSGGHVEPPEDATGFQWNPFEEEKEAILDGWAEEFVHDMQDALLSEKHAIGLTEVRALRDCFEFADLNGSGRLQQAEVEFFLDSIGFSIQAGAHAQAFKQASQGLDLTQGLDVQEAVSFVCAYQKSLANSTVGKARKAIDRKAMLSPLYAIGCYMSPDAVESLLVDAGITSSVISEEDFNTVLNLLRSRGLLRWSVRCGFDQVQVDTWRRAFDAALQEEASPAAAHQTEITTDGAIVLLRQLYAQDIMNLKDLKPLLYRAISRVDRDNSGALSFTEFLFLLRHLLNLTTYKTAEANLQAIQLHKLDPEAAEHLLNLFNKEDTNHDGRLESQKIVRVFQELQIANSEKKIQQVKNCIHAVTEDSALTFPQFLQVLQDIEHMGI